jgi:zinc-binding in reverse transcriptase
MEAGQERDIHGQTGYQRLSDAAGTRQSQDRVWEAIWNIKNVTPKVKIFLWRACQGALATARELHRRIRHIQPIRSRCQQENEYTTHLLFFCPSSRAIWFASDLAMHVDELPLDFKQVLVVWGQTLTMEQ